MSDHCTRKPVMISSQPSSRTRSDKIASEFDAIDAQARMTQDPQSTAAAKTLNTRSDTNSEQKPLEHLFTLRLPKNVVCGDAIRHDKPTLRSHTSPTHPRTRLHASVATFSFPRARTSVPRSPLHGVLRYSHSTRTHQPAARTSTTLPRKKHIRSPTSKSTRGHEAVYAVAHTLPPRRGHDVFGPSKQGTYFCKCVVPGRPHYVPASAAPPQLQAGKLLSGR